MKEIKLTAFRRRLEQHDFNYHYIEGGHRWWQFSQDNDKLQKSSKESRRHKFLMESYYHKNIK